MKCIECGATKQAVEMVVSRSVIVCSECAEIGGRPSPPAEPKCEQLVAKGEPMNKEQIRRRITEIRKLSDEILASEEGTKKVRAYTHAFVHYQIDEDGDECYHITIDECSPTNYEAQRFLVEKLRERGVTEQIEISSEW